MASPTKKPRNDFEHEINEIIEKQLWSDLSTLLQDGGLSDAEQCGAVEAASKHCAQSIFLSLISPHCTSNQLQSALPHLASRGLWQAVGNVLQRGVSPALLAWSIKQAVWQCTEQKMLSFILPHCANDQLDFVLAVLVKRGLWRAAGVVIQQVHGTTRRWAIEKACHEAGENKLVLYILPACSAVETACALAQVVNRGLWRAVGEMLQRGVSDTLYMWTLQEAFKQAECKPIRNQILPYCTRDYLNRFMSCLISKGRWNDVDTLMQCVEDKRSTSTLDGAPVDTKLQIWTVRGVELEKQILQLVAKGRWRDVCAMITEGVEDSLYDWLIHTACLHATKEDFLEHVLPHCSDRLLNSVLTVIVGPRAWVAVEDAIKQHVIDSKIRWAVLEACNTCDAEDVSGYETNADLFMEDCGFFDPKEFVLEGLLPRCTDGCLCVMLSELTDRYLERYALRVLERGVDECRKQWAVQKACEDVERDYSCESIKNEDGDYFIIMEKVDNLLVNLVTKSVWRAVENAAFPDYNGLRRDWNLRNSCEFNWEDKFSYKDNFSIISGTGNDTLKTLVDGRLLLAFTNALGHEVSDSVKWLLVKKACKTCMYDGDDDDDDDDVDDDDNDDDGNVDHDDDGDSDGNAVESGYVGDDDGDYNNDDDDDDDDCADGDGNVVKCGDFVDDGNDDDDGCNDDGNGVESGEYGNDEDDDDDGGDDFDCNDDDDYYCDGDDVNNDDDLGCSCDRICLYLKKFDTDETFDGYIINSTLPYCSDDHLKVVFPTQNLFNCVRDVLIQQENDTELRLNMRIIFESANESLIETVLPCYVYDDIRSELETLASRRLWKVFLMLLHYFTIGTLHSWVVEEDCSEAKERVFWDMLSNPCDGVKELSPAQWRLVSWSSLLYCPKEYLDWDTLLCEVLHEALLATVREVWLSGREKEIDCRSHAAVEEAKSVTEDIHLNLTKTLIGCKSSNVSTVLPYIHRLCHIYAGKTQSMARGEPLAGEASQRPGSRAENKSFCTRYRSRNPKGAVEEEHGYGENNVYSSPLFQLHFLKYLAREYFKRKAWTQLTEAVLAVLTTTPVVPGVQSVALKILLREKKWDVIRHACLSYVCEQDRRVMFQAAVKQRKWDAVKRWADYSLYDDQRLWALGVAKEEQIWDVYLKLADHGLNESERMGVLCRVAKHAHWKLVRHMVNTVADVSHMKDLLTNARPARMSQTKPAICHQRIEQFSEFEETLKKDTNRLKTLKIAAKRGKWQVVLYNIRHKPELQYARLALSAAVSSEAWQTVIQLVRLETDVTRRDLLFRDMVRQQQWDVCRELLQQGVSDDVCFEALSDLMEHRQWTLVAMVMRCPMREERRTEVMYRALMMREGSVVWQCINSLQRPLSSEQRENIFQLAFKREVWQAVKPLVKEKDETGIRHRDTALLEAIEQHQWDVVDHCQRYHADINMKDDDGHTPIHRAARKEDWEAVKELTVRDGDPNLLDSEGYSVLHRAINTKQWNVVKLVIQFHGDIHLPTRNNLKNTGLNMLIDARQTDVIQSTFMWCADQWKGVNYRGETTLHAACLSGSTGILHDLIARRVSPLAVTSEGLSALCYAVLCRGCAPKMVAECIKLGFSTHQPHVTGVVEINWSPSYISQFTCPLMLGVMLGLPVVTQILYESGACSNRQLFNLSANMESLARSDPTTGLVLEREFDSLWRGVHGYDYGDNSCDTVLKEKSAVYLRQMSSTPRSLVSTCRLVISHCLTLNKTRHRDIAQLPLSPVLKNYLMFTDLTDPYFLDQQD